MQEVDIIINNLIESIKSVDSSKSIPYLVKDLDKHVQEAYAQLYDYRAQKSVYKPLVYDKKGHCC